MWVYNFYYEKSLREVETGCVINFSTMSSQAVINNVALSYKLNGWFAFQRKTKFRLEAKLMWLAPLRESLVPPPSIDYFRTCCISRTPRQLCTRKTTTKSCFLVIFCEVTWCGTLKNGYYELVNKLVWFANFWLINSQVQNKFKLINHVNEAK